jgi:hypothetical protein
MIATLRSSIQEKFESVPLTSEVNKTLGLIIRYTLIGTGALFLCYSYFVGAITFSVINQQDARFYYEYSGKYLSANAGKFDPGLRKQHGIGKGHCGCICYSTACAGLECRTIVFTSNE